MNQKTVLRSRDRLLAGLPPQDQILRGSLLKRTISHKAHCARCARGGGHTAWILTITYPGGRNRQFSVRPEQRTQVRRWLRNYRDLRTKLEQICELNHELLWGGEE